MTFLSMLRRESRANIESPAYPLTSSTLLDLMAGPKTSAGVNVTEKNAVGLSAVWRAVSLISQTCAGLPLHAYRDGPNDTRERVKPDPRIIREPHPDLSDFEFVELVFVHLLLWGNAYIRLLRDSSGIVRELWPIHPARVLVGRASDGHKVYAVDATDLSGRQVLDLNSPGVTPYTDREILHIPALSLDGIVGLTPIQVFRTGLSMALAAEEFGAKFYGSGTMLSGILSTEAKVSEQQADAIKERWKAQHTGPDAAMDISVLGAGTKFQPISIPPKDAEFIESRRFQVAEVARMYGVPPHLLMDTERTTSWGTGIETQTTGLVVFNLAGWLSRYERRMSRLLPQAQFAKFTVSGLMRGDTQSRFTSYATGRQWGWLSVNDIRRLEDMPPVEGGGDDYLQPLNMVPLGTDETPADQPSPPPTTEGQAVDA